MRVNVTLACTECGDRNYITKKNKRNNPDRIELKKYCPRLKKWLYTEKLNNKVREALKYQRLRLFVFPFDPHI